MQRTGEQLTGIWYVRDVQRRWLRREEGDPKVGDGMNLRCGRQVQQVQKCRRCVSLPKGEGPAWSCLVPERESQQQRACRNASKPRGKPLGKALPRAQRGSVESSSVLANVVGS